MTQQYPPQYQPQPPAPAQVKPRKPRKWPWVLGILVAFGLGAAVGSSGSSTPTASAPSPATVTQTVPGAPSASANPTPAAQAAAAGPKTSFGDGTYLVGTDIAPGSYRTTGPRADSPLPNCYFARAKDDSGSISSIEQNDNTQGAARVTVKNGEYLTITGCDWTKS